VLKRMYGEGKVKGEPRFTWKNGHKTSACVCVCARISNQIKMQIFKCNQKLAYRNNRIMKNHYTVMAHESTKAVRWVGWGSVVEGFLVTVSFESRVEM